jgi:bacterioferritin-associated ferredoxin
MYVCVCRAVTEQQVKSAIDAGATTVSAVRLACRAGDDCGACHGLIDELIEERRSDGSGSRRKLPVESPVESGRAA